MYSDDLKLSKAHRHIYAPKIVIPEGILQRHALMQEIKRRLKEGKPMSPEERVDFGKPKPAATTSGSGYDRYYSYKGVFSTAAHPEKSDISSEKQVISIREQDHISIKDWIGINLTMPVVQNMLSLINLPKHQHNFLSNNKVVKFDPKDIIATLIAPIPKHEEKSVVGMHLEDSAFKFPREGVYFKITWRHRDALRDYYIDGITKGALYNKEMPLEQVVKCIGEVVFSPFPEGKQLLITTQFEQLDELCIPF